MFRLVYISSVSDAQRSSAFDIVSRGKREIDSTFLAIPRNRTRLRRAQSGGLIEVYFLSGAVLR